MLKGTAEAAVPFSGFIGCLQYGACRSQGGICLAGRRAGDVRRDPVEQLLSVTCEYKSMSHFGDTVLIIPILKFYNGIRMTIEYSVTDKDTGELRCVGETRHCFLTRDGKPVSLKKSYLEMDRMFQKALPQKEEQ